MRKKIASLISLFILFAWLNPATAAKPNPAPELPETDGVFDVPGHPGMKVRVFVHKTKPAKPAPTSTWKCELSDPMSDALVGPAGWRMEGDWTFKVNPNVPATISPYVETIANNAVTTWMSLPELNEAITLKYDGTTPVNRAIRDGQNIIAWGRTSGSALGVTYVWYQNGQALELDTIMNQKFNWKWSGQATDCAWTNAYDAQDILTHELGHWFGLNDHYTSAYADNTMFGYGSPWEVKKNTLTGGDIAGINNIY